MDNDINGTGNSYDFGARIYDPRISRWLSIDPARAAWQSPYVFVSNSPVGQMDPDGKWQTDGHYWTVYLVALLLKIPDAQSIAYYTEYPDTKIHGYVSEERYSWSIPLVQQGTHSLTGKDGPRATLRVVHDLINADFKDKQELGRLLHKLGDTYAHRVLKGSGQLYGNPFFTLNHAASDGSEPDMIKNRMDDGVFEGYIRTLTGVLASKYRKFNNANIQQAVNTLLGLGDYARKNNVSLKGIINYEVAKLKGDKSFFVDQPTSLLNESNAKPGSDHLNYVKATKQYLASRGLREGVDYTTHEIYDTVKDTKYTEEGFSRQTDTRVFRGTEFKFK